ncbi:hybrid sensor histidine kinase/response regulator [Sphingomicrobium clamense]|uniref:histidine kinase n=1 Tax=Sphingomicrobium clamense TaxID=2851013 RepID=A0ABS6V2E0_9SPHN|nr:PAS domain-containing protein [Sphingomicrobium sp. B8]MBW0143730.1 PAS domain-containing protein [Sphingomicrobium sp. B8]
MANWGDRESPSLGGELFQGVPGAPREAAPDFEFSALLAIADTLPVMVAYCGCDQKYLFLNKTLANWFERPRSEILGKRIDEVMSAEAYALRRSSIERALSGEEVVLPAEFQHPTRGRCYTKATYRPHLDSDGDVIGLVMIVEDITDHRTAMEHQDARFRAVFESMEMAALLDLDARIIEMNQKILKKLGVTMEDVAGRPVLEVPFISSIPESQQALRVIVEGAQAGKEGAVEIDVVQGGEHGVHLVSVRPVLGKNGEPEFLIIDARDLSELKIAQEQLRQAQKMEALGQLTGGIAHDFNNLLTVVVGGLDMINRRVEDAKTAAYATNALAAAERGARLTGQLLAFSRAQKLEVRPSNIAQLIEQARPLLRNVLGPGIEKRFFIDEDVCPAMADPTQLEVALLNLAVNARDAMPDGGCLCFGLHKIEIEEDPEVEPGDYLELSVQDTGSGMDEDVRARVFEPFFTTKDVGKGTGLGLSMVYGMARQSGGTARIESTPGKGTTVTLLLRCAEEDVLADDSRPNDAIAKGRRDDRSVLVVDDDDAVRTFMVETLRDEGFVVHEAADGRDALEWFAEEHPDLVVLDYIMPGLTGAEVARQMLEETPGQPILFVSGYSETDAIRASAPDAKLLAKPFRGDALVDALRNLVEAD